MEYFIAFLEGIITFISPCFLPMLPVYVSYFAGTEKEKESETVKNAVGFITGFTVIFVIMGAMAGTVGQFMLRYKTLLDIVTGGIVVFFGLNFLGVFKLNLFKGSTYKKTADMGFFSAVLFGMVFSVGWTPCVGAFLGSALMLAATTGHILKGTLMLFLYSLGLGIPFFISALLIDRLKTTFSLIKRNYRIINAVSGILLVVIGVLMMTGIFGRIMTIFA